MSISHMRRDRERQVFGIQGLELTFHKTAPHSTCLIVSMLLTWLDCIRWNISLHVIILKAKQDHRIPSNPQTNQTKVLIVFKRNLFSLNIFNNAFCSIWDGVSRKAVKYNVQPKPCDCRELKYKNSKIPPASLWLKNSCWIGKNPGQFWCEQNWAFFRSECHFLFYISSGPLNFHDVCNHCECCSLQLHKYCESNSLFWAALQF